MSRFGISGRSLALIAVLVPLAALFVWVALRSGPLAPVPVTVVKVGSQSIAPALFGIGTVEARYTHRIGPTVAGRVLRVDVQVGDRVDAGQSIGEMDSVDIDQRLAAQAAAVRRAQAEVQAADAQILDAAARRTFAQAEERRYEQLAAEEVVSQEAVEARRQESQMAAAGGAAQQAAVTGAAQGLVRDELAQLSRQLERAKPPGRRRKIGRWVPGGPGRPPKDAIARAEAFTARQRKPRPK